MTPAGEPVEITEEDPGFGWSIRDYATAVAYINRAGDQADRHRRKAEVFMVIYGGRPAAPYDGPVEGRFIVHGASTGRLYLRRQTCEEVERSGLTD